MPRLLNAILEEFNTTVKNGLSYSVDSYALAYQQEKEGKTFPVINIGGGQGKALYFDDVYSMRMYHRMLDEFEQDTDLSGGLGKKFSEWNIYPMRVVFVGKRSKLTSRTFEDNIEFCLQVQKLIPKFMTGGEIVQKEGHEVDKNTVYAEEFAGAKIDHLSLDGIAFWIDYTLRQRIC